MFLLPTRPLLRHNRAPSPSPSRCRMMCADSRAPCGAVSKLRLQDCRLVHDCGPGAGAFALTEPRVPHARTLATFAVNLPFPPPLPPRGLNPTPVDKLCFPLQLEFSSLWSGSDLAGFLPPMHAWYPLPMHAWYPHACLVPLWNPPMSCDQNLKTKSGAASDCKHKSESQQCDGRRHKSFFFCFFFLESMAHGGGA